MQKEIIFNNLIPRLSDLQLIHLLIGKALLLTEALSALRRKNLKTDFSLWKVCTGPESIKLAKT